MEIPEIYENESLLEYSERVTSLYATNTNVKTRKSRGQFFTPHQISKFMGSLFEIRDNSIRLLDPGAGTGILTAGFCERLLTNDGALNIVIDVYENDDKLIPILKKVLELCKLKLEEKRHTVDFKINKKDFILYNAVYFEQSNLLNFDKNHDLYDYVISNPPYYKLNKEDPQSKIMNSLVSGQPNIYALFMALSASMLKTGGEMVFITPRSFCSGLYYKKFRKWFLDNSQIINIHIFESRKEIFDKDNILQENVILKAKKEKKITGNKKIFVSTSRNKDFYKLKKFEVKTSDIIYHKNGDIFIRIPTSSLDVDALHVVDSWPKTLNDLGLKISTGPVIPFRAEEYLLPELVENTKSYPLLWMHNMKNMRVVWPLKKNNKSSAIRLSEKTIPLLLPVNNYVLLNRFSSKEQKRRLYSAALVGSEFPYEKVGIENHLNYIYRPDGNLSLYETFGISAILNTTIVDNVFRSLNGNTQVNATDIRSFPFPNIEDIIKIGKIVYESKSCGNGSDIDNIVARILGIDIELINKLNKGGTSNE